MKCPHCGNEIASRLRGSKEFYKAEFVTVDENISIDEYRVEGSPFILQCFMCTGCKRRFFIERMQDLYGKKITSWGRLC